MPSTVTHFREDTNESTTAGSRLPNIATAKTVKHAKNFPSTMPVTPTGAVRRAWSVLLRWSSLIERIVRIGTTIMHQMNMVL